MTTPSDEQGKKKLSPEQLRIARILGTHQTVRLMDVVTAMGMDSHKISDVNNVHRHLNEMVRKGVVKHHPRGERGAENTYSLLKPVTVSL